MMDFYEVVDQAIKLLQQRGRLTYRALKRQFDLDDEVLEDLKEELLYSQPQVVDDEGKGLMWTGASEAKPEPVPASPPDQTPQPDAHVAPPISVVSPPAASHVPEAERRQLTVMFCDLVDSTRLSSQLDPEDYRDVVRAYQSACTEVIRRYDGYIAQYLGDGLLIYFGYPQAHEEDAQRAVHTGLGILNTLKQLNSRLEQEKGIRLALRIGIHTGLVVVGDIGAGPRQEQLALGETPNVAARIQGRAEPDTVVISVATFRLVQGYFECQELGEQVLRGVAEPITVYRVLRESGIQSRLEVASSRDLTPLVGREQEVGLLIERWDQVKDGQGQVILLSGEAGIGKSRLVQVLKDHISGEPHTRWECRSFSYYQNSALYPITELLQRTWQLREEQTPEQRLEKLEQALRQYRLPLEESIPLLAPLLSLTIPEDRYPPLHWAPQWQRQKTLESILAMLLELAEHQPVLFILEDLHWLDPTSLELLDLLIDHTPTASIYTLLTCRPTCQPSWSPRTYLTEMTVNRLSNVQAGQVVKKLTGGRSLPPAVLQQIIEKSDGVPLYLEEMTKAVLESGHLKEGDEQYEIGGSLASLAIPATLQDSLMARLDRLVSAKGIAQLGAVLGRQFSYELLEAVSQLDTATLQRELGRLVETELLYQRGLPPQTTYTFKHALIQDAAYESLLKSTRQQYHQQIGHILEARFPETIETQPELLAHHYTEAGLTEQAVDYWQQAGEKAIQRSAHVEAVAHLSKSLELLKTLPDTPENTRQELSMQLTLGRALQTAKGNAAPEVEQTYTRAWQLCQQLGETSQLFRVMHGMWSYALVRADYQRANDLVEQYRHLAQGQLRPIHLMLMHDALGIVCFWRGALRPAQAHLEQTMALDDPHQHHALSFRFWRLSSFFHRAWVLWALGYPEQALQSSDAAFRLVRELAHPFYLAFALNQRARVYQFRREVQGTREQAEASIRLSTAHGFAQQVAAATFLGGWALTQQGQHEQGITEMDQGLAAYRATGAEHQQTYFLALLAEGYGRGGQREEGLTILAEALALADKHGERIWEAELYRLKGELLLQQSSANATEAQAYFQQAISVAQNQSAKSWELCAATSLARLWQQQGKRQEAYNLLAPVYNWFTEGFDTADLKDAKGLLEE